MPRRKKMSEAEVDAVKRKIVRREGKTKDQFEAEVKATRVVEDPEETWPPRPTDGEDDEA